LTLDLIIRNASVSTAEFEGRQLDIGISHGEIVELAPSISTPCEREVDAMGKDVFPGFVDPHTHMELPVSGTVSSDDFYTGTVAAACGGITTIVDFAGAVPGQSLMAALDIWRERAGPKAVIDHGFHMIVPELEQTQLNEIPRLVDAGVNTVKCMMAYKRGPQGSGDGNLVRVAWKAAESGALPMVHAENGDVIDATVDRFLAEGKSGPEWHFRARPPALEAEAVHRAIEIAAYAQSPMYIVHLSSAAALDQVVLGRERGRSVMTETCPQYLTLTSEEYDRPGFEPAKFVCSPPLRGWMDQKILWRGIEKDRIQLVASDHCPFYFHGQKDAGVSSFDKIPNGIPTIQAEYSLLWSGVMERGMSRSRFVELSSTNAAKIFGMFPRKGDIAVGSEADLVIFDADRKVTLSRESPSPLRERVDYTPYEGRTVTGWPDTVISRGEVIVSGGEPVSDLRAGRGQFVARRGGQWHGWGAE
jgi:dihydropyrimidinase